MKLERLIKMGVTVGASAGLSFAEFNRSLSVVRDSVVRVNNRPDQYWAAREYSRKQLPVRRVFNRHTMDN